MMKKQQMRGFLDPISLGFVLSLLGTATVLSVNIDSQTNQDETQAQTVIEQSIELTKAD